MVGNYDLNNPRLCSAREENKQVVRGAPRNVAKRKSKATMLYRNLIRLNLQFRAGSNEKEQERIRAAVFNNWVE